MQKTVLITGANGMVAKELAKMIGSTYSIRFLTRKKQNPNEYKWDIKRGIIENGALQGVTHIVHLAGAGIADKRWTTERKRIIHSSRVASAKLLFSELQKQNITIQSFISASATGYYGTITREKIFCETDKKGDDFLSQICEDWENVAHSFTEKGIAKRSVILRFGVVLGQNGGAFPKMIRPIQYFLGASLGTGKQFMPWIHIEDLCGILCHSLQNESVSGIYNAVAPQQINNSEFTKIASKILKRPLFLPNVPSFLLKWLFGEMSVILLEGSRISADKIIESGYEFQFGNLESALRNLLQK